MSLSKFETPQNESKSLIQGAKDLMHDASSATVEKTDELLAQGSGMLKAATDKAHNLQAGAINQGKKIAGSTDEYVRGNPWKSVGIAAGAAVLLGAVLSRRKS